VLAEFADGRLEDAVAGGVGVAMGGCGH
jgi:hypothetical protein